MGRREHRIQLSGFTNAKKSELSHKIATLGGIYTESECFDARSTHIVCGKPSRSEKFLGGLATGKWLLTVDYIHNSYKQGRWLDEDSYEWNTSKCHLVQSPDMNPILAAAKRWRQNAAKTGAGAFLGWRVAVLVENVMKKSVYKRLLQCGGAAIVNIRLPIKRPGLVARDVSHVFVDPKYEEDVKGLLQNGVLCISPMYIGIFLIMDPPPGPRLYLVGEHNVQTQTQPSAPPSSSQRGNTFQPRSSNRSVSTSVHAATPKQPMKKSKSRENTVSSQNQCLNNNKKKQLSSIDQGLGSWSPQTTPSSNGSSQAPSTRSSQKQKLAILKQCLTQESNKDQVRVSSPYTEDFPTRSASPISNAIVNLGLRCDSPDAIALRSSRTPSPSFSSQSVNQSPVESSNALKNNLTENSKRQTKISTNLPTCSPSFTLMKNCSDTSDKCILRSTTAQKATPSGTERTSQTSVTGELNSKLSKPTEVQTPCKRMRDESPSKHQSKRRRIELPWEPACPNTAIFLPMEGEKVCSLPLSTVLTGLFEVSFDESHYEAALSMLSSSISKNRYPQAKTLHAVLNSVLMKSQTRAQAYQTYDLLRHILSMHPPTSPALRDLYLRTLRVSCTEDDHVPGEQWTHIKTIIRCTLGLEEVKPQQQENCLLFLRFIVAVMETNFAAFHTRCTEGTWSKRDVMATLWAQVIWPSGQGCYLNTTCSQLIVMVNKAVALPASHTFKMEIVQLLQSLLTMTAQCCHLADKTRTVYMLSQGLLDLVRELAVQVKETVLDDLEKLTMLLSTTRPAWLTMHLVHTLLGVYDSSLLPPEYTSDPPLTLTRIVARYFYLLPPVQESFPSSPHLKNLEENRTSQRKRAAEIGSPTPMPTLRQSGFNCSQPKNKSRQCKEVEVVNCVNGVSQTSSPGKANVALRRRATTINKKNLKEAAADESLGTGETALHRACIKNDVGRLRDLLQVPGVDINTIDNAGWSPLHEVCNLGNIECLVELLNYRPPKTITSYFKPGCNGQRCLDLNVGPEGLTPLHDAVSVNQTTVARILLQYGGSKLLNARTSEGLTPLDLAVSDTMRGILESASSTPDMMSPVSSSRIRKLLLSNSQCSSSSGDSQESQPSATYQPAEEVYQQVLDPGRSSHVPVLACQIYARLVVHLVQTYQQVHHTEKLQSLSSEASEKRPTQTRAKLSSPNNGALCDLAAELGLTVEHLNGDYEVIQHWSNHVQKFRLHLQHILRIEKRDLDRGPLQGSLISLQLVAAL